MFSLLLSNLEATFVYRVGLLTPQFLSCLFILKLFPYYFYVHTISLIPLHYSLRGDHFIVHYFLDMKIILLLIFTVCSLAMNISTKTLVILDNKDLQRTHSKFFKKLESYGQLTFAYSFDKEIKLKYYD
jgi:hypothetical protein